MSNTKELYNLGFDSNIEQLKKVMTHVSIDDLSLLLLSAVQHKQDNVTNFVLERTNERVVMIWGLYGAILSGDIEIITRFIEKVEKGSQCFCHLTESVKALYLRVLRAAARRNIDLVQEMKLIESKWFTRSDLIIAAVLGAYEGDNVMLARKYLDELLVDCKEMVDIVGEMSRCKDILGLEHLRKKLGRFTEEQMCFIFKSACQYERDKPDYEREGNTLYSVCGMIENGSQYLGTRVNLYGYFNIAAQFGGLGTLHQVIRQRIKQGYELSQLDLESAANKAVMSDNFEVFNCLVEYGAKSFPRMYRTAAEYGAVNVMGEIIKHREIIDDETIVFGMYDACIRGRLKIVNIILPIMPVISTESGESNQSPNDSFLDILKTAVAKIIETMFGKPDLVYIDDFNTLFHRRYIPILTLLRTTYKIGFNNKIEYLVPGNSIQQ
jgi:hypothetical protein